jgi:AraC-like DNA-binding protein
MRISAGEGLERSCNERDRRDWFRTTGPHNGVECLEAWFSGHAYATHRHDTYAIGITDQGAQTFTYRGTRQTSTPGNVIVLHPDEPHDGCAGTEDGFGYRMIYVEPSHIAEAARSICGGPVPLPFVTQAVSRNTSLQAAITVACAGDGDPIALDGVVAQLAEGLLTADTSARSFKSHRTSDYAALKKARDYLHSRHTTVVSSVELEAVTGLNRYDLARQFKSVYGTSPYRYLLMRRLEATREGLHDGATLADLAAASGFADQAHFTRMFKKAYGMTPAHYRATGEKSAQCRTD